MVFKQFYFPKGSWDCSLEPEGDGFVAMWNDDEGSHIYEMSYEENGYLDSDEDIPDDDLQYYSEDIYTYRD